MVGTQSFIYLKGFFFSRGVPSSSHGAEFIAFHSEERLSPSPERSTTYSQPIITRDTRE